MSAGGCWFGRAGARSALELVGSDQGVWDSCGGCSGWSMSKRNSAYRTFWARDAWVGTGMTRTHPPTMPFGTPLDWTFFLFNVGLWALVALRLALSARASKARLREEHRARTTPSARSAPARPSCFGPWGDRPANWASASTPTVPAEHASAGGGRSGLHTEVPMQSSELFSRDVAARYVRSRLEGARIALVAAAPPEPTSPRRSRSRASANCASSTPTSSSLRT